MGNIAPIIEYPLPSQLLSIMMFLSKAKLGGKNEVRRETKERERKERGRRRRRRKGRLLVPTWH